ncbi:MAG: MarR family transcriptional regulator [Spirochaetia bacterium]|nr:MarR family transcriptional regulator [Spirochaetia bacterium]
MEFEIEKTLGYKVNRLAVVLRQNLVELFNEKGYDVTAEEWILLNRLWEKDGRTQSDLAETTLRDQTTVTRLMDKMEKKGFVTRKNDTADRRVVLAYLTPLGTKLKQELIPIAMGMLKQAGQGISKKNFDVTLKTLEKCLNNLQ